MLVAKPTHRLAIKKHTQVYNAPASTHETHTHTHHYDSSTSARATNAVYSPSTPGQGARALPLKERRAREGSSRLLAANLITVAEDEEEEEREEDRRPESVRPKATPKSSTNRGAPRRCIGTTRDGGISAAPLRLKHAAARGH